MKDVLKLLVSRSKLMSVSCIAITIVLLSGMVSCKKMQVDSSDLSFNKEAVIKIATFIGGDEPREFKGFSSIEKNNFVNSINKSKVSDPPGGVSPSSEIKYVIEITSDGRTKEVYCGFNGKVFFASGSMESRQEAAGLCRQIIASLNK
jgi:hypothetical protein